MAIKSVGKFILFVLALVFATVAAFAFMWSIWMISAIWHLNHPYDRLIIIVTSIFWLVLGGFLWLSLSQRKIN